MSNIKCMHCGLVNFASEAQCRRCQSPIGQAGAGQSGFYGYHQQPQQTIMPTPSHAPVNQEPYQGGFPSPTYVPTANGTVYSEGATYGSPNAYYSPYMAAPAKLKQGLAITSLVFGCVGLAICFIGLLGARSEERRVGKEC